MASQCEDCDFDVSSPKGMWWKYEKQFNANELLGYASLTNPLEIDLGYEGTVDCEFHVDYGCDDGEIIKG